MALSADSEKIVEAIWNHIAELHAEWKTLIQLFGVSQAQSDFLNKKAGDFFETVHQTLIRDILLGISRLTDPLSTAGKDNLVLERLLQLPEVVANSTLSSKVAAQLIEVKAQAGPIRDYRNKYLAHLDLVASLAPGSDVLPGIARQDIDGVLESFSDLFNLIEQTLQDRTVAFKRISIHGGPEDLLKHLEDAESWQRLSFPERRRIGRRVDAASRDE
jgi:hypothetical protein